MFQVVSGLQVVELVAVRVVVFRVLIPTSPSKPPGVCICVKTLENPMKSKTLCPEP